jgi:hypothetical protein
VPDANILGGYRHLALWQYTATPAHATAFVNSNAGQFSEDPSVYARADFIWDGDGTYWYDDYDNDPTFDPGDGHITGHLDPGNYTSPSMNKIAFGMGGGLGKDFTEGGNSAGLGGASTGINIRLFSDHPTGVELWAYSDQIGVDGATALPVTYTYPPPATDFPETQDSANGVHASKYTLILPAATPFSSFYIPFTAFSGVGTSSAVDWTAVTAFRLSVGGNIDGLSTGGVTTDPNSYDSNLQFKVNFLAAGVPEPSSALLLLLGLVPMWRKRRSS